MGIVLLNKFLLLILFLSILNVIKEGVRFIWSWIGTDQPQRLILSEKNLFLLGLSISYILLCIFSGIKI